MIKGQFEEWFAEWSGVFDERAMREAFEAGRRSKRRSFMWRRNLGGIKVRGFWPHPKTSDKGTSK